jgi:succinate dehydrogenase / fumarate reductase cytochrome b subunit
MAGVTTKDKRPVYLNLLKIRLPVAGMVSLAHRASGILMFLAMPFVVYLLDLSVQSNEGFEQAIATLQQPLVMAVEIVFVWALAHHLFAGIRFLLLDADICIDKKSASITAWLVMLFAAVAVLLTLAEMLL